VIYVLLCKFLYFFFSVDCGDGEGISATLVVTERESKTCCSFLIHLFPHLSICFLGTVDKDE
jgi:hypothetical protein